MPRPPKDGMITKFAGQAMPEIRALVPDFKNETEANKFYTHFIGLKRVQGLALNHLEAPLPDQIAISNRSYRCTAHPHSRLREITLIPSRANPMEILHVLAHYFQPSDSAWHKGEFGAIFLSLVDRKYGAEMKRKVADIMVSHGIKTYARSEDARIRQSQAYYAKKAKTVPQDLVRVLDDMRALMKKREEDG